MFTSHNSHHKNTPCVQSSPHFYTACTDICVAVFSFCKTFLTPTTKKVLRLRIPSIFFAAEAVCSECILLSDFSASLVPVQRQHPVLRCLYFWRHFASSLPLFHESCFFCGFLSRLTFLYSCAHFLAELSILLLYRKENSDICVKCIVFLFNTAYCTIIKHGHWK